MKLEDAIKRAREGWVLTLRGARLEPEVGVRVREFLNDEWGALDPAPKSLADLAEQLDEQAEVANVATAGHLRDVALKIRRLDERMRREAADLVESARLAAEEAPRGRP